MARYGSSSVGFLLVAGRNQLASDVFSTTGPDEESVLALTHGLGRSWETSAATGVKRGAFSQTGLFDDEVNGNVETFLGQQNVERIVAVNFEGNVLGRRFTGLQGAFGSKISRPGERGGMLMLNVDYTVAGSVDEGVILEPLAAKTANWTGTSVDNAALTSNGGAAHLQVTAYSGFTGVVAKVQHSVDNSVWVDLATFTNVTSAPGAQRVAVAAGTTVNRYLRGVGTVTGSGSMSQMTGFARG